MDRIKITYYGNEKDIAKAVEAINKRPTLHGMRESRARLEIQKLIDKHDLHATIMVNGNTVWSKKRITQNLHRILKHKTLYNPIQEKPPFLSQYFYQFLSQCCGSIAHYDIHGWIHKYPTIEELKQFFKENEFNKRVLDWIHPRFADAKEIVKEIEIILFPFQSYIETRQLK